MDGDKLEKSDKELGRLDPDVFRHEPKGSGMKSEKNENIYLIRKTVSPVWNTLKNKAFCHFSMNTQL